MMQTTLQLYPLKGQTQLDDVGLPVDQDGNVINVEGEVLLRLGINNEGSIAMFAACGTSWRPLYYPCHPYT